MSTEIEWKAIQVIRKDPLRWALSAILEETRDDLTEAPLLLFRIQQIAKEALGIEGRNEP